jgi:hypothetical protein
VCGSSARTDLCGGRPAMVVPTATGTFTSLDAKCAPIGQQILLSELPVCPRLSSIGNRIQINLRSVNRLKDPHGRIRRVGLRRSKFMAVEVMDDKGTHWVDTYC